MIEKIEAVLYAPTVQEFVHSHPYIVWGGLTVVISLSLMIPVLWKWPKKPKY